MGNGKLPQLLTFLASTGSALKYCSNMSFKPSGFSCNQSFMQKFLEKCQFESHKLVASRGTYPSTLCQQQPILSRILLSLDTAQWFYCYWYLLGLGLLHVMSLLSSVHCHQYPL